MENSAPKDEPTRRPDVAAIMADIRARVKADIAAHSDSRKPYRPYAANNDNQASRRAGELLASEDLRYLNQNRDYASVLRADSITTHRRGFVGKLLVRVKQKLMRMMRYSIFRDYFASEAEFNLNLVRFLNDLSKYVDARDGSIFWELIRKVDYDVAAALERIERINDEHNATLRSTEKELTAALNSSVQNLSARLAKLESQNAAQGSQLQTLDSVARGLEGIVNRISSANSSSYAGQATAPQVASASYVLLENRYRGSEAEIRERLKVYPPIFAGAEKPILEIGPGRGELLALFKEAGLAAYGIDIDPAMAQIAREKGFDAREGDALDHLRNLPDGSLGGVIAIQVVEHLHFEQLKSLIEDCGRKIASGGKLVFETVNPQSLSALSSNYFRDPTHVVPLHPDTLAYAFTLAGLEVLETKFLSPVSKEAQLRALQVEDFMSPRWRELVELFNHNINQLNQLLYGFQDYCVVGRVR